MKFDIENLKTQEEVRKHIQNCEGGNMKYSLTDTHFPRCAYTDLLGAMISSLPKTKPNRSIIGKKAYKTFLKNGGSRNSKGQFSKKEKYKIFSNFTIGDNTYYFKPMRGTSIELFDNQIFIKQTNYSYSAITIEKPTEKEKIDWEKIGKDLYIKFYTIKGTFSEKKIEHAKAFAKVFQKHGLIDKGVEI